MAWSLQETVGWRWVLLDRWYSNSRSVFCMGKRRTESGARKMCPDIWDLEQAREVEWQGMQFDWRRKKWSSSCSLSEKVYVFLKLATSCCVGYFTRPSLLFLVYTVVTRSRSVISLDKPGILFFCADILIVSLFLRVSTVLLLFCINPTNMKQQCTCKYMAFYLAKRRQVFSRF